MRSIFILLKILAFFSLVYSKSSPIWIQVESGILFKNDVFISFDEFNIGSESIDLSYEIGSEKIPDKLHWRLLDKSNTIIFEDVVPAKFSGSISWNGQIRDSVVSPGKYMLELEAFQKGVSLGISNRRNIIIYRISIDVAHTSSKREKELGVILEVGAKFTNLIVQLEPRELSGSIVLHTVGNSDSFIVTDNGEVLPLGKPEGVSFTAADLGSPKVLQVLATFPTVNPTKFRVKFIPEGSVNGEALHKFVYLHALELNLTPICTNKEIVASKGVFLQRNPHTITTTEDLKKFSPIMHPLIVTAQPSIGNVTEIVLEYESGSANAVLYDNTWTPSIVSLPKTWTGADFNQDTKKFELALLVSGNDYGEAVFNLSYLSDGTEIAKRLIKFRVDDLPSLAGSELAIHPFFNYQQVFNYGGAVKTAIDPFRFSSRTSQPAAIYVVPHRSSEEWANNKSLTNAALGPIPITIEPTTTSANITEVTPIVPGSYDIIYDFGNCPSESSNFVADGTLNAGDIIDTIISDAPSITAISSLLEQGTFSITTTEYGAAFDITTLVPQGYDGLNFLNGYNFRLRGRLVFPDPLPDKTPLVVLAHGNHVPRVIALAGQGSTIVSPKMLSDENYRGYTYLQRHLASHGYATLSVDLDETYGFSAVGYPEILGYGIYLKANLILRNLEEVLTNPNIAGGDLHTKIDPTAIYLIGHSRGGEAVINAQALLSGKVPKPANSLPYLIPSSNIKGIISIAPTSRESTPVLSRTPFLLIYGSADRDVDGATRFSVWPFTHFDRATKSKSHLIYAIGANHNYFNDSWPLSDLTKSVLQPYTDPKVIDLIPPFIDLNSLLSRTQQKDLVKAYSLAFLKAYHEQQNAYLAYLTTPPSLLRPTGLDTTISLTGAWTVPKYMTKTVIDDYEDDSNPSFNFSSSGTPVTFTGLNNLAEGKLTDKELDSETEANNRFFQDTNAALFDWNTPAEYGFEFAAPQNIYNSVISLRVAQQPLHTQTLALDDDLDFSISIIDNSGNSSVLRASAWLQARRIYPSSAFRDFSPDSQEDVQIVWDNTTKGVFETFTFPWWAFIAEGRTVDLGNIEKITLHFGKGSGSIQGRIAIDNVEIWRYLWGKFKKNQ